jgi:uncharacterized coiled-coil protein SlyX
VFGRPTGQETSADVYRLLSQIHAQLEGFEQNTIGGLSNQLRSIASQIERMEAQLHRIEQRLSQR